MSRKDQTLSDKRNISFNRELCIVIITTSPFDQHQARNDLDNFNTTLSSLLYSYQIYLKKHGHTINMNDHIVIFEYSTKNKNTYKKYYVNKYRAHHTYANLMYTQNINKDNNDNEWNWHRSGVKNEVDALKYCANTDENIKYVLLLEDDTLIGDQLFDHLQTLITKISDNSEWFYIRLFHTEFWSSWGQNPWHYVFYCVFCGIPIMVIHNFYGYKIAKLRGRASTSKKKNRAKKCSIQHMKQSLTFIESTLC